MQSELGVICLRRQLRSRIDWVGVASSTAMMPVARDHKGDPTSQKRQHRLGVSVALGELCLQYSCSTTSRILCFYLHSNKVLEIDFFFFFDKYIVLGAFLTWTRVRTASLADFCFQLIDHWSRRGENWSTFFPPVGDRMFDGSLFCQFSEYCSRTLFLTRAKPSLPFALFFIPGKLPELFLFLRPKFCLNWDGKVFSATCR